MSHYRKCNLPIKPVLLILHVQGARRSFMQSREYRTNVCQLLSALLCSRNLARLIITLFLDISESVRIMPWKIVCT